MAGTTSITRGGGDRPRERVVRLIDAGGQI
jgi:hypothetical protein